MRSGRQRPVAALLVLLVSAALLMGMPARAMAPLCMSDDELRAFLAEVALYKWNISGKICLIRHYEDIDKESWKSALLGIERASATVALKTKQDALEPFKRTYPGKHDEAFDVFIKIATKISREFAAKATASQCDELMNYFSIVSQQIEKTIETEVSSAWGADRQRVERCL